MLVRLLVPAVCVFGLSCGEAVLEAQGEPRDVEALEANLSASLRRERLDLIRQAALERGLHNALLVAGVAQTEASLGHCLAEAPHACPGPVSPSCNGPVLAGRWDGPCDQRLGGLGIFQLDSGNHDDTLTQWGESILSAEGNAAAGARMVLWKLRVCPNLPRFATQEERLAWLDQAWPGTEAFEQYLTAMAWCYNGCAPTATRCDHSLRREKYRAGVKRVLDELGEAYWRSPAWRCEKSAYRGQQYWTCGEGARFRCVDGLPVREACAAGCEARRVGTDDVCR